LGFTAIETELPMDLSRRAWKGRHASNALPSMKLRRGVHDDPIIHGLPYIGMRQFPAAGRIILLQTLYLQITWPPPQWE
jgi:hypothetical protein